MDKDIEGGQGKVVRSGIEKSISKVSGAVHAQQEKGDDGLTDDSEEE